MRHILKTAVILILLSTSFSCSKDEIQEDILFEIAEYQYGEIDYEILQLLNEYRTSIGLQSVQLLDIVSSVAYNHNEYMISVDEISHNNFGERCQQIRANEAATTISENLGYGYTSAASVVNAWLNSPGHRANIESDRFTHIGISSVKDSSNKYYYTNILVKVEN